MGQSQILPYLLKLSKSYSFTIISFEKKNNNFLVDNIEDIIRNTRLIGFYLIYKNPLIFSTLFDLFKLNSTIIKL